MIACSFEQRIASFFEACKDHLEGKLEENPALKLESSQGKQTVFLYIEEQLAKQISRRPKQFKKPIKTLKYGYIGDKKGLNGIRDIHENDGKLFRSAWSSLNSNQGDSIMEKYHIQRNMMKPVKVVAHETSGRRIYGFMDKELGTVVLFGIGYYK